VHEEDAMSETPRAYRAGQARPARYRNAVYHLEQALHSLYADGSTPERLVDELERVRAELAVRAQTEEPYESVRLTRTGDAPLAFNGRILADVSGKRLGEGDVPRWHDVTIYETAAGQYVVAIAYRTTGKGDLGRDTLAVVADRNELRDALKRYDPVAHVQGVPSGPQSAEKQARLVAMMRQQWEGLIALALTEVGVEERVE
jgi:hypothetical protein